MSETTNIRKCFLIGDETHVILIWCPNKVEDHVHLVSLILYRDTIIVKSSLSIWRQWEAELAWE